MGSGKILNDKQKIWQKDIDHYVHPWTDFSTFKDTGSLVVAEAEGAYVYDADGRQYLDGIAGLWCVNAGYGRDEIGQAMADQAKKMVYYSSFGAHTSIPAAELASKLAELAPGNLNRVFYGTGGSMSNDTNVRMIHFYFNQLGKPKKKQIITRHDGYHGSTYMAMSLTGVAFDHDGFDIIGTELIHRINAPNMYRRPEGTTASEYCDILVDEFRAKIEEIGPEKVAAFFAEPIIGAGGVLVPPPDYHKRMLAVCCEYGILYVADEVVTAFGRLGHFFASEAAFDIVPDFITAAKGLTSAYSPLSASIFSEEIYDVISIPQSKGGMFTHGFTYSGHPVSCAAALANIAIMEREDIPGHVRHIGPYFQKKLETLMDLPLLGDVRGSHFMMCLESVADRKTKELINPDAQVGNRIADACEKRGLLVRPLAHLNILSPPLVLNHEQIDWMVEILRESIVEVMMSLKRDGFWTG